MISEILQSHVWALVTEEFYNSGKADAGAQHLRPVGVSKLVRDDADGNPDGGHNVPEFRAQPARQHITAAEVEGAAVNRSLAPSAVAENESVRPVGRPWNPREPSAPF